MIGTVQVAVLFHIVMSEIVKLYPIIQYLPHLLSEIVSHLCVCPYSGKQPLKS